LLKSAHAASIDWAGKRAPTIDGVVLLASSADETKMMMAEKTLGV
jgi:hypothetical protein